MSGVDEAVKELEYFYKKLEEAKHIPSEFTYNLNAFISRGRTITWIIKKQYSKQPNFVSWYSQVEKEMRADELMQFFVNARNVSLKEHSIRPSVNWIVRNVEIKGDKALGLPIEGTPFWIEKNEKGEEVRKPTHEFNDRLYRQYYFEVPIVPKTFRNLQAIDLCKIYLENLREIATQATTLFKE